MAAQLPEHTLMTRAGAATAALSRAIAPHARSIWVACGPGNNGGDGLMAAALLAPWAREAGVDLSVSCCANASALPWDAQHAWRCAVAAGVRFADQPPAHCDLAIDALLGIGTHSATRTSTAISEALQSCLAALPQVAERLLSLDIPSGLCANTGKSLIARNPINKSANGTYCLTFIGLKPGLLTGQGRDWCGDIWLDDLGLGDSPLPSEAEEKTPAWLIRSSSPWGANPAAVPMHNTHKGRFGDVWVLGGQGRADGAGMAGAAILAGRAALHARAGRVFVALLDSDAPSWDTAQPELMLRDPSHLLTSDPLPDGTWVCGCGGGTAVAPHLDKVLTQAPRLVLDADALNAVANSPALQTALRQRGLREQPTAITPHPLEAARLLDSSTPQVQADRVAAAVQLAAQFHCICVLKGSGTVLASPSGLVLINASGNGRLATAGTGDVLAGMVGAALAVNAANGPPPNQGPSPAGPSSESARSLRGLDGGVLHCVASAVWLHGHAADQWNGPDTLTASSLARRISPAASAPPAATQPRPRPTNLPHPPRE